MGLEEIKVIAKAALWILILIGNNLIFKAIKKDGKSYFLAIAGILLSEVATAFFMLIK